MAPFVLLNSLNEYLCPGCSAHMLLVYRDPGHLARKEAVVVDILGGDLEDGTWGSEAPRGPETTRMLFCCCSCCCCCSCLLLL
ncbi:unnamed protein product [Polarella glacialis]|uniref:Uncharacterized protein n=1 Tax=Polarella glacialis TaxID=89957 RepID=A0A813D368_POLGL|nr:unnamed protein product [Polarella glacialis]